jgi:signal transduction histidine kinase
MSGIRTRIQEVPVESRLIQLEAEEGTLVTASIRDVTDQQRAERLLEETTGELEQATLEKNRFLGRMGHELRTPLNAIIGFTGTLLLRLPGPLTADQDEQLQIVRTSARHLLSLINDLLDVAKIESGTVVIEPEPLTCQQVLSDVVAALHSLAEAKGLTLELRMPAQTVMVHTDRQALDQILLNLTNHAIIYTETGFVRLEIDLPSADAGTIEIRVFTTGMDTAGRDTQPGDEKRLFKPFAPLIPASSQYQGTGLGLHLSQKLAERLGGSIRWTSELKHGSAFVLSLPRS